MSEFLHRFFKESEREKINKELLNEIYPMETLNKYYLYGYANCLSLMTDITNHYIDNNQELNAEKLKKVIDSLVNDHENINIKDFYSRLRKDEVKTR